MLTDEQFNILVDPSLRLHEMYVQSVLNDIARRLRKAGGDPTRTAAWQLERLLEGGAVYEDALSQLAELAGMNQALLEMAFERAGVESVAYDDQIYIQAGFSPISLQMSENMRELLYANARRTDGEMRNLTRTTAMDAQRLYITASDVAFMQVAGGAMDYNSAIKLAIRAASRDGLSVTYPSGHRDKLDVAVRRAVLTGVGQATGEVQLARGEELGQDLFQVSAHAGARPSHAEWQGGIYSLSGNHPKYGNFKEITGWGTGPGLGGYNCRHSFYPFFEGLGQNAYTKGELAEFNNAKVNYNGEQLSLYDATQYQRSIEREIRNTKREAGMLGAAGLDQTDARNQVKRLQAKMRDFIAQTGLSRQYVREGGRIVSADLAPKLAALNAKDRDAFLMKMVKAGPKAEEPAKPEQLEMHLPDPPRFLASSNALTDIESGFLRNDEGNIVLKPYLGGNVPQGIFTSKKVKIPGGGEGILKTNKSDGVRFGEFDIETGFARREVGAYEVDKLLGLGVVPETFAFVRHGEYYSVQKFVEGAWEVNEEKPRHLERTLERLTDAGKQDPAKIHLLDHIIGNQDRHAGNWLTDRDRLYAIDNGLSMVDRFLDEGEYSFNLADFAKNKDGKMYLDPAIRDQLKKSLDDGSLKGVLNEMVGDQDRGAREYLVDAAIDRAGDIVYNWEDVFWFEGPKPSAYKISDDGQTLLDKWDDVRHQPGAFESELVQIQGEGPAILKTDYTEEQTWGAYNISEGFARREVGTYEIDQLLGLDIVPKTTAFIEDGQYNSLQRFVPNAVVGDSFGARNAYDEILDKENLGKMQLLDFIMLNRDRHNGNWVWGDGKVWAIDNGLAQAYTSTKWSAIRNSFEVLLPTRTSTSDPKWPLDSSYRDKLQDILEDPRDFRNILEEMLQLQPNYERQALIDATFERISYIVGNWDSHFTEDY